jgi:hypothetical protein
MERDLSIYRSEKHRPAVANAPANHAPGITFCSNSQREDLSRVEPGDRQPRGAKHRREDEDHGRCARAEAGSSCGVTGG